MPHPTNAEGRKPDSYSYHEVTECDDRLRVTRATWTVVAEWMDGEDVDEVDNVADFKTEAAAEKHAAKLNAELEAGR